MAPGKPPAAEEEAPRAGRPPAEQPPARRLLRLAAALAAVALVWLVALPWAARRPAVSARLDWLDDQKVDPAAMYYTELEMMKPIFTRLALEQRPQAGGPVKAEGAERSDAETGGPGRLGGRLPGLGVFP